MKPLFKLISYTKSLWKLYALIGAATVSLALLNLVQPFLIKGIIDRLVDVIGGGEIVRSEIIWLVIGMFLADAGVTLISNLSGYWGDIMAVRIREKLTLDYFNQLMLLPQSYFDNEKTGAILNRLDRSLAELRTFMNVMANNFLQFILTTIFTLIVIAFYSWEVALLLGALYPIFLWLTQRTSASWQTHQKKINEIADVGRARFTEAIAQVKVVKAFVRERDEGNFQVKKYSSFMDITRKQSAEWHKHDVQRRLVLNVIFLVVFVIIGLKGFSGELTIGEIVLLSQFATSIRLPLFSMSFIVDNTQRAIAGSKEFFEVMELSPEIKDQANAPKLKVKKGEIKFDRVSFSYEQGGRVLNDISFSIKPGQKLALVGESGQGKTTISNLLLRFYEPQQGRITIDNQDISEVTQHSLRSAIGVVFQDPSLFSGTIRENICFGKPNATKSDMIKAAKAANAHEFISKLKNGYNTEIGERGIKLSGGQQQRIAIARAILNDPPILLLDEATSSLDSKAEAQVQSALDRLVEGRTTLIIAHRLSTIKDVDTIVTLRDGSTDEIGSPAELAKTDGIYAMLLSLQESSGQKRDELLKKFDMVA